MARDLRTTGLNASVFDEFSTPWNEWLKPGNPGQKILTVPAVNILEGKSNFSILFAVPGMRKEDFKIDVQDKMLTISIEKEEGDKRFNRREYNYSSFSRSFSLPENVKKENIEARYDNGILVLILPKKEEVKKAAAVKSIAVK